MIFLVDISDSQNQLSDTLTFLSTHLRNTFLFISCHAAVAHSRRMPRNRGLFFFYLCLMGLAFFLSIIPCNQPIIIIATIIVITPYF